MLRGKCPKCGGSFFVEGNTQADVEKVVSAHVAKEHGSVEEKHSDVLHALREMMQNIFSGVKVTKLQARVAYNAISDLLALPSLPADEESPAQPPIEVDEESPYDPSRYSGLDDKLKGEL